MEALAKGLFYALGFVATKTQEVDGVAMASNETHYLKLYKGHVIHFGFDGHHITGSSHDLYAAFWAVEKQYNEWKTKSMKTQS